MTEQLIDRARARAAFDTYVAPYDATNPRVALKIEHTLRVAELAERIARKSGFTPAGIDLAWLCGLLHDIGRFEQLRRWDTFRDGDSADHAAIGVDVLFAGGAHLDSPELVNVTPAPREDDGAFRAHVRTAGTLNAFLAKAMCSGAASTDGSEAETGNVIRGKGTHVSDAHTHESDEQAGDSVASIVRAAVGLHSAFRLLGNLDVRTRALCDVVRDADKIDILRVTCTDTVETVLGVGEDKLLASTVSPATEEAFFAHRCVRRDERSTPADYLVGLACFTYELVYPASLEIALEQDFLFQPFERPFGIERPFADRATARLMNQMDGHLRAWMDERLE